MKNIKKFVVNAICAGGLLALVLTGCTKEHTAQDKTLNTEVSEVAADVLGNIPEEEKKVAKVLNMNTESASGSEKNVEHQDLIDAAVKDFKNYFEVTVDPLQYDVSVFYTEKQGVFDAQYEVIFGSPENTEILMADGNMGSNGFPIKEVRKKLKPGYYAAYSDDKKVKCLQGYNLNWEETSVPITVGECKEIAEEFLKSNHMIMGGKMEYITSKVSSDFQVYYLYKNGTDGGIGVTVNTYTSKVEQYVYMNQEELELNIKQVEEGIEGVG